jgi:hypothetical protein
MLRLDRLRFPLYKLRAYIDIDTNLLGKTKITTVKGVYVFDDKSLKGDFEERRAQLPSAYPDEKVYKLKERVIYMRQLVKYKSGTTFVDSDGNIIQYKKSTKQFEIRSLKITRVRNYGNWSIIYLEGDEQMYIVGHIVLPTTKYASLMYTKWGPLLYDLTSKKHEPYKRKI